MEDAMPTDQLESSYIYFLQPPYGIARQIHVDEGCILDVTPDGKLVGVEIIGPRTIFDVLPLILAKARF